MKLQVDIFKLKMNGVYS